MQPISEKSDPTKYNSLDRQPTENEWKCPNCGKIHYKYVGTCGCGELRPQNNNSVSPSLEKDELQTENDNNQRDSLIEYQEDDKTISAFD